MTNKIKLIFFSLVILLMTSSISVAEKNNITATQIGNQQITNLRVRPSLSTADTCGVRHDLGRYWQYGDWVVGNELYKNYMDPSLTCAYAYPYSVTEIAMQFYFPDTTSFTVSVDVEKVDSSNPNCPMPDTIMLGLSDTWNFQINEPGYYNIIVPFNEPVIVNEPFFAGFFIGEYISDSIPSILTDSNSQVSCVSYNIWEDTIGFVDLKDYGFLGRLLLFANGIPGGGPSDPAPHVSILFPSKNKTLYKSTKIWAYENSGSPIIDYVSFAYFTNADTVEIGRDYDGTKTFRDGINPTNYARGFNIDWDFSSLPEGDYKLLVTVVDTLGRFSSDQIDLFLEPTPPIAQILSPSFGVDICPEFDILMSSNDDNLTTVKLDYKKSEPNYSIGAQTLLLSDFGNYYSAAIAASLAIQAIEDQGHYYLMRRNSVPISTAEMANLMAEYFSIDSNSGVYDENIIYGFQQFNKVSSNALNINYIHTPNYFDLRTQIELNGNVALAGLGGTSNNWILIDGFSGTQNLDGTYNITISNPLTAQIETVSLRNQGLGIEINYNGGWQPIEIIIHLGTDQWTNSLTTFGVDLNRIDGWAVTWAPTNLWQGADYYIRTEGNDMSGLKGYNTTMYTFDCTQFYLAGDFNNDGSSDITDLEYLISYFINQGAPPIGGDNRADTNCDGFLNITDIVYYANFIFGQASTPCY